VLRIVFIGVFILCLAAGCGDDTPDPLPAGEEGKLAFPEGFLFGGATAGFQCDMGCPTLPSEECTDTNSDWYAFVTSAETVNSGFTFLSGEDPALVGPGHWELYRTDLDLAAGQCHHNAFRMSMEWSRIFPTSTIGVQGHKSLRSVADQGALAHYHDVLAALEARGLEPLVTLHHYTLPSWIHDGVGCHLNFRRCWPRGWVDTDRIVPEIAKYAGFVAREFGGEVDLWGTLNEPYAVLLSGYLLPTPFRSNPPSLLLQEQAFRSAYGAMIDAHARMYDAVKENDVEDANGDGLGSQVGIAYAVAPVAPKDPGSNLDRQAAENVFYLWNTAFLDAVTLGEYDERFDGEPVFREELAGRMDYLGINYKVRVRVEGLPFSFFPSLSPLMTFNPLSLEMDEVYPRGLFEIVTGLSERYGLPVYITENNGQSIPKGQVETEIRFLVENLTWLWHAIAGGADVRGYFYWALMDNFEWNHGMNVPLGLYQVNPDDPAKDRVPRETVAALGTIAASNGIPLDMAERYPVDFGLEIRAGRFLQ
jgi:beta-glucosidase/6-phospho-beta-glucosidase/beta-galactosidase